MLQALRFCSPTFVPAKRQKLLNTPKPPLNHQPDLNPNPNPNPSPSPDPKTDQAHVMAVVEASCQIRQEAFCSVPGAKSSRFRVEQNFCDLFARNKRDADNLRKSSVTLAGFAFPLPHFLQLKSTSHLPAFLVEFLAFFLSSLRLTFLRNFGSFSKVKNRSGGKLSRFSLTVHLLIVTSYSLRSTRCKTMIAGLVTDKSLLIISKCLFV